jgi:hypothetical protein
MVFLLACVREDWCANERVGARLDRGREFLQVLRNVPEIVEEFVDVLGIDVQGF